MRILITGICGFAGHALATALPALLPGLEITGLDSLARPGSETNRRMPGVRFIHADLRCASDLDSLPAVDWVIDAAAQPSVLGGVDGKSSSRQMVEHNLRGTVNLLEYCKRHRAGLILLSTSRVCSIAALNALPLAVRGARFHPTVDAPGLTESGIAEDFSTAAPVSLYGSTKLASEALALEYSAAFDFPVYVNRCGVLAGAGQFGTAEQGLFSWWVHAWKARRPLRYIGFGGAGHQVRDALHPADLARLIAVQLQSDGADKPRLIHLGGGMDRSMSLAELSAWCADTCGAHEVGRDHTPRAFDVPWLVMDSSRAAAAWNWQPEISLPSILEEIARHAADHPDWLNLANA